MGLLQLIEEKVTNASIYFAMIILKNLVEYLQIFSQHVPFSDRKCYLLIRALGTVHFLRDRGAGGIWGGGHVKKNGLKGHLMAI